MKIAPDTHVADVVAASPAAIRVFQRYGIDFCCGGRKSVRDACTERGLPYEQLREELEAADIPAAGERRDWRRAPLGELVVHILSTYHRPLREELPRLEQMAEKVLRVHGEFHPDVIPPLVALFRALKEELESHMLKEEEILFPAIDALEAAAEGAAGSRSDGGALAGPIAVMEDEHERAGRALAAMRHMTRDYMAPPGACETFRGLFRGFEELEGELHQHIHLENDILFPRAQALSRGEA